MEPYFKKATLFKFPPLPNPNLRHLQLKSSKHIQSLPILKNDSRAQELKNCTIKNLGKVVISNTCAFNTVSSILMVSINDSHNYKVKIDECNNEFLKFTAELITNGITSRTYLKRAEIMVIKYYLTNINKNMLYYNDATSECVVFILRKFIIAYCMFTMINFTVIFKFRMN